MRSALVCLLAMTAVALAQPPGEVKPPAPEDEVEPLTYALGVDGHAAVGTLVEAHIAARFDLGLTPGHTIVVRGGVGKSAWSDSEIDDPTYRELLVRVGYRISSRHLFAGIELGRSWFKARFPPIDMYEHHPVWFGETGVNVQAGVLAWRVRVSLDYELRFHQLGLRLGFDIAKF